MKVDWDDEIQQYFQRIVEGDESAAQALVEAFEPEIRIIARRQLGNMLRPYLDSMDIVQSVHRILLQGVAEGKLEFENRKSLMGFVVTVVRRKAAGHWRKHRRQQRESGVIDALPMAESIVALNHESDPKQMVTYKDQVQKVLDGLSEVDRQLIELKVEGYSTKEAAVKLGLDPDQMRVRLSRLRKRLNTDSWRELFCD